MGSDTGVVDLAGHVVFVTGGARGIGAAVSRIAARAGAAVAIGYRTSAADAELAVQAIRDAGGLARAIAGDFADPSRAREATALAERELGPIDCLVNSAGIMATGDFLVTDEDEWLRILRGDLLSAVFASQAVLPGMLDRGAGAIVNVSSRLAEVGAADAAPYAAAKAAIVSLTRSLALAYGAHGIRVNAVSPGTTNTDMGRATIESDAGRERAARIPIRRFVEPSEVASAIVFLLSDAASGISGQTLHVNGGEWMA